MKYEYRWSDWAGRRDWAGRLFRHSLIVVPLACVAAGVAVLVAG